ncbi:hypothetical protein PVAP13_1NG552600 [Panicum virgatum]|uniref:Uncharacterized protein n=1 Tax=Panicum virgatum TaxID=38727 RepID=A0A8T0X8W5_PANVG|nr:hypothetical protein PVAP13_1NG552600 [Panicum virgatum]KAG2655078.1 hypothetical protein PVAP13_1NG552600 [Panicum virgatum]
MLICSDSKHAIGTVHPQQKLNHSVFPGMQACWRIFSLDLLLNTLILLLLFAFIQAHGMLSSPEMAPLKAQGSKDTGEGSCADGVISLEEIIQEPLSAINAENVDRSEGQNATDDNFSVDDLLSACPRKDNDYVGQDCTLNGSYPADGDDTHWPLRAYSNQNYANGTLSAEEFFDTQNDSNGNTYSEYQQVDGFPAPHQVDGSMVFYDAPSDYNLVDGNDDFVYLNDLLNEPFGNESLFDGDDMMAYFDATENDFKYDILGSAQDSNYQLADMPTNFAQKGDNKDKFALDGISKSLEANTQYGASSSGSLKDMYPDTAVPGVPTDDTVDKTFGKRLASMLGSIPAPPAMASEPSATGKSVGALSAVSPSSIRVTAGIIQLDGLTFSGVSERWPLQKNGDFNLLLSFTVESDVSSKPAGFEQATRISTIPMVLRSGMYLFFVSAMILLLSYKVGSCVYSR